MAGSWYSVGQVSVYSHVILAPHFLTIKFTMGPRLLSCSHSKGHFEMASHGCYGPEEDQAEFSQHSVLLTLLVQTHLMLGSSVFFCFFKCPLMEV